MTMNWSSPDRRIEDNRDMKESIHRIRIILTALLCMAALMSCNVVYDHYPEEDDEADRVLLVLRFTPAATTRADSDSRELMHSLRVVLLDDAGMVEYNRLVNGTELFGGGLTDLNYSERVGVIPTRPGDKKIFLVANEESVTAVKGVAGFSGSLTALLNGVGAGDAGFEAMIKSVSFSPDYSQENIVLSSSYKFNIGAAEKRATRTFSLVHAATKFDFEFLNLVGDELRIDDLSVSAVADEMYLMANFGNTAAEDKTVPYGGDALPWIEWLEKVCNATNASPVDPDNEWVNSDYGWITDYELPGTSGHTPLSIGKGTLIPASASAVPNFFLGPVYSLESKYVPQTGDQKYSFSITLTNTVDDTSKTFERLLTDIPADGGSVPNLKTLFRNTHVKTTIVINKKAEEIELELRIGVCPWYNETIDIPTFD